MSTSASWRPNLRLTGAKKRLRILAFAAELEQANIVIPEAFRISNKEFMQLFYV